MFFRIKLFSRLGGCASQLVRKLFEEAREYASSILCRESGKISDKSHNWRKIASLTMSAVSSGFRAHSSMRSKKSAISL